MPNEAMLKPVPANAVWAKRDVIEVVGAYVYGKWMCKKEGDLWVLHHADEVIAKHKYLQVVMERAAIQPTGEPKS